MSETGMFGVMYEDASWPVSLQLAIPNWVLLRILCLSIVTALEPLKATDAKWMHIRIPRYPRQKYHEPTIVGKDRLQ